MRLTTQSEYAFICLRALCPASADKPLSIQTIVNQEKMSKDYVEQLFLKLKKAGILNSVKGMKGGYFLTRSAEEISLRQIIEAVEGDLFEAFCKDELREKIVCTHHQRCSVRPIWYRFQKLTETFFESISLKQLYQEEEQVAEDMKYLKYVASEI